MNKLAEIPHHRNNVETAAESIPLVSIIQLRPLKQVGRSFRGNIAFSERVFSNGVSVRINEGGAQLRKQLPQLTVNTTSTLLVL